MLTFPEASLYIAKIAGSQQECRRIQTIFDFEHASRNFIDSSFDRDMAPFSIPMTFANITSDMLFDDDFIFELQKAKKLAGENWR